MRNLQKKKTDGAQLVYCGCGPPLSVGENCCLRPHNFSKLRALRGISSAVSRAFASNHQQTLAFVQAIGIGAVINESSANLPHGLFSSQNFFPERCPMQQPRPTRRECVW